MTSGILSSWQKKEIESLIPSLNIIILKAPALHKLQSWCFLLVKLIYLILYIGLHVGYYKQRS